MNREIKFRVWDKKYSRWENMLMLLPNGDICYEQNGEVNIVRNRFIIQQYTGLKDFNGKEIYEGDILDISGKEWGDYKYVFVEWNSEISSWQTSDEIAFYDWEAWEGISMDECPIVGNVFENPELLKNNS